MSLMVRQMMENSELKEEIFALRASNAEFKVENAALKSEIISLKAEVQAFKGRKVAMNSSKVEALASNATQTADNISNTINEPEKRALMQSDPSPLPAEPLSLKLCSVRRKRIRWFRIYAQPSVMEVLLSLAAFYPQMKGGRA